MDVFHKNINSLRHHERWVLKMFNLYCLWVHKTKADRYWTHLVQFADKLLTEVPWWCSLLLQPLQGCNQISLLKFCSDLCVFAEWVEVRTWDSWLNLVAGQRHSRSRWMWIPCSSVSSGHSEKSSSLFSSATRCCSALCCLPDGPLISWWESEKQNLSVEEWACSRT